MVWEVTNPHIAGEETKTQRLSDSLKVNGLVRRESPTHLQESQVNPGRDKEIVWGLHEGDRFNLHRFFNHVSDFQVVDLSSGGENNACPIG